MSALSFHNVVKRYPRSATPALDHLSFSVPEGVVCGLVGPNGAGKTTAFSVVCGFLHADAGSVDILGAGGFDPFRLKGRLGVLPQDAALPDRHTPRQLLVHLARLQGLSSADAPAAAQRALVDVGLTERADERIHRLSHGMRRRVAAATAMVGSPELVLLDEPMAGLDPAQAKNMRQVITSLRGRTTVVVSSHNLTELERICDWVVMVDKGRCLREGSVASVTGTGEHLIWQLTSDAVDLTALRADTSVASADLEGAQLDVTCVPGADLDAVSLVVMRLLLDQGVGLRALRRGVSLEDRFLDDAKR